MVALGHVLTLTLGLIGDPSPKSFDQWWSEALQEAQRSERYNGSRIEWTQAITLPMPDGGIEALRDLVKNKPDHPGRYELRRLESQAREGPEVQSFAVLRAGDGRRVRLTRSTPVEGHLDAAVRESGAWIMSDRSLTLRPALSPNERGSVMGVISGFDPMIRSLLTGGFAELASAGATPGAPPSPAPNGDWTLTTVRGSVRVLARGSFDARRGLGSISELVTEAARPAAGGNRTVTRLADWHDSRLGYLPHSATIVNSPSGLAFELRLKGISPVSDAELDELTRDPNPERPDPIRGATTFTDVLDERGDGSYQRASTSHGAEAVADSSTPTGGGATSPGLLVAGWSLAGVIGLFLAWSGWRRFKGG